MGCLAVGHQTQASIRKTEEYVRVWLTFRKRYIRFKLVETRIKTLNFLGRPSICFDTNNVDWAPSLHVGNILPLSMNISDTEILISPAEQQLLECIYNLKKVSLFVIHLIFISTQVGSSQLDKSDVNGPPERDE